MFTMEFIKTKYALLFCFWIPATPTVVNHFHRISTTVVWHPGMTLSTIPAARKYRHASWWTSPSNYPNVPFHIFSWPSCHPVLLPTPNMFALGLLHMQMTSYLLVLTVFVWMLLNVCFVPISFRLVGQLIGLCRYCCWRHFQHPWQAYEQTIHYSRSYFRLWWSCSALGIYWQRYVILSASKEFFFAYFYFEGDVQEFVKDWAINLLVSWLFYY